jgi:hypothetical protein
VISCGLPARRQGCRYALPRLSRDSQEMFASVTECYDSFCITLHRQAGRPYGFKRLISEHELLVSQTLRAALRPRSDL